MGLEQVVEEIRSQTEGQRSSILAEAKKEASIIEKEANEKASAYSKSANTKLQQELVSLEKTELAAYRMQLQKQLLQAKKNMVEKIMHNAKQEIKKMKVADKKKLYRKLLHAASEQIEPHFVITNPKDKVIVKKLSKRLKHRPSSDMLGGIIVEDADSALRINYSFDLLLQKVSEVHSHALYDQIF